MEQELATSKYIPLIDRSVKDLQGMAKSLGMKLPQTLAKEKLVYAITVEQTKQTLKAEAEARRQLAEEKGAELGISHPDRNPSFEEVAIYGGVFNGKKYPPAKRVLCSFINVEDAGSDVEFTKGGIYFHIFENDREGKPVQNVMPECLISQKKEYEDFASISLVKRGIPVFGDRVDAAGRSQSVVTGYKPRFRFIVEGEAPEGAEFGLYLPSIDEKFDGKLDTTE